jgi:hypothetical protein
VRTDLADAEQARAPQIQVVLGWFEELKERVPRGK